MVTSELVAVDWEFSDLFMLLHRGNQLGNLIVRLIRCRRENFTPFSSVRVGPRMWVRRTVERQACDLLVLLHFAEFANLPYR